jgi:hypothetical protein
MSSPMTHRLIPAKYVAAGAVLFYIIGSLLA